MADKLRVALCMGGGVSLGAFSGGALAEILRQILYPEANRVLRGLPREFESIGIDVFMGASAGSLTLAMMLRGLSYSFPGEGQVPGDALFAETEKCFDAIFSPGKFAELRANPEGKDLAHGLVAATRVEALQYRAWVERVSIENLCSDPDPGTGAGLFDSRFLGTLGADLLGLKGGEEGRTVWRSGRDTGARALLADRVVFGSTITPMHALDHPAAGRYLPDGETSGDPVLRALLNRGHRRDARLFDIRFSAAGEGPSHWVRVQSGRGEVSGARYRLDIDAPGTWEEILRTSLASGAVPVGFTPVVLKRHECEFGGVPLSGLVPEGRFVEVPYVDGGMFNNEPVEETARICRYLDENSPDPVRRLLFFVDSDFPAHPTIQRFSYQTSVASEAEIERKKRGPNPTTTGGFDKSVNYEPTDPIHGALGVATWSVGTLYGHARVTRKTPVLPEDFSAKAPDFLENVIAFGPVAERGKRLVPADLRGEPLAAFAGFLLEAWRRHDFARGRCAVYDTLKFGPETSRTLVERMAWRENEENDGGGPLCFRPPEPAGGSQLTPEQEEQRDEAIGRLADHIRAHLDDWVGWPHRLVGSVLRILGVADWEKLIATQIEPPVASFAFEMVLPGGGWELEVRGLRNSAGLATETPAGEPITVFALEVRGRNGGAVDIEQPGLFEIHTPWIRGGSRKARAISGGEDRLSPVDLAQPSADLRSRIREMLLHGAIGLRLDASGNPPRWRLYQPPNPIDVGFRKAL